MQFESASAAGVVRRISIETAISASEVGAAKL